jgi:hypothetical protein
MTLIRIEVRAWLLALLLLLGSGSLAVAAGSLAVSNRPTQPSRSPAFTVAGSLTLIGEDAIWWSGDERCRGAGEFADIHDGARVMVQGDLLEEYLGAGRLSGGSAVEMKDGPAAGCEFFFEILDIPTGQSAYILSIGRHAQRYAEEGVYHRYLDLRLSSSPSNPSFFAATPP